MHSRHRVVNHVNVNPSRGDIKMERSTGTSSEIRTKLRDWAVGQVGAGCYSWAALSSNDSETLYRSGQSFC